MGKGRKSSRFVVKIKVSAPATAKVAGATVALVLVLLVTYLTQFR